MKYQQATRLIHLLRIRMLYRRAFPASERKPFPIIASNRKRGTTDIWYFSKDGAFVGFATTVNSKNLILLDYLAVPEKLRGQGFGSEILAMLRMHYVGKGLFLEIESVLDDTPNLEQRLKRKQFYLSNGMTDLHTEACVFGVNMELLGFDCQLSFDEYREFYRKHLSEFAARNVTPPVHKTTGSKG